MAAIYFRLTIPETPRFSKDVLGDDKAAMEDARKFLLEVDPEKPGEEIIVVHTMNGRRQSTVIEEHIESRRRVKKGYFAELEEYLSVRKNWMTLLGTSMTWFLLDIGFYGTNLNTSIVLSAIGFADTSTPYNDIWSRCVGTIIIALAGNVPVRGLRFLVLRHQRADQLSFNRATGSQSILSTNGDANLSSLWVSPCSPSVLRSSPGPTRL
jgi:PHS family inorganic phosphate transporter-like MFS transporter